MSTLYDAVQATNDQGALALMLYAIPNFPDPDSYQEILHLLNGHPAVTIIETTFPVTAKFSEFANQTIQQAHQQATAFADDWTLLERLQPFAKPSVCVLYRETLEKWGYETILEKIQGKIDGILFEWEVPAIETYVEPSNRYGIELIQCAVPEMSLEETKKYLDLASENPLVYLVSAPMTGAETFAITELAACVQLVKTLRPDAKVMAGFGIRSRADIQRLSHIEGLDGVIIGTAFLEVMKLGSSKVTAYLDELAPALTRMKE
ncbi:MAG: tryptophan synthase subunit alpha [Caldilineaceae bacterium]